MNNGLNESICTMFSIFGDRISFAGTNGSGVFLSTNNGTSWGVINDGCDLFVTSKV